MIPVDKEAIRTPTLAKAPTLDRQTHSAISVIAEDTSHLTASDYLSVYADCQAVNFPDSQSHSGRVLVIF